MTCEDMARACEDVAVGGWRPIATALKDGKDVWCYDRADGYYAACLVDCQEFLGFGRGLRDVERWHNKSANKWSNPTHWQPLPAPPVTTGGDQ